MTEDKTYDVVVKFVGDEDVFENIVHISHKGSKEAVKVKELNKKLITNLSKNQELITDEEVTCKKVKNLDVNPLSNNSSSIKVKKDKKNIHIPHSLSDSDQDDDGGSNDDCNAEETSAIKDIAFNNYFIQHASKKHKTSTHTLAELKINLTESTEWKDSLKKLTDVHIKEKNLLKQKYQVLFNKWYILLNEGFNILLYGLGSKIQIMETFYKNMLYESEIVVINGFFPGITIKHILNIITEEVLQISKTFRDMLDQVNFIKEQSNKKKKDLYLIINNIDAPLICSEKNQTFLSLLAQLPYIHIIASIDHINAPLIWDQTKLNHYNWIWFDVTSFNMYSNETSYENSLLVQKHGRLALSSLLHVFNSLTPNAQGIFMILARYQYDQRENSNYAGMSFHDCYQKCREAFLVNSDLTLRSQLTEFLDHKILRLRKSSDGIENLLLLLDENTLHEFLELQDNS